MKRDQSRADAADRLDQANQLFGLAAVRQRQHDVVFPNRAEIPVDGFGGVQEPGRRAGARERSGDLPADDARLAHARHDDAAATLEQQLHGLLERSAVEAIDEAENRRASMRKTFLRQLELRERLRRLRHQRELPTAVLLGS